jgi:hypothetical protein
MLTCQDAPHIVREGRVEARDCVRPVLGRDLHWGPRPSCIQVHLIRQSAEPARHTMMEGLGY